VCCKKKKNCTFTFLTRIKQNIILESTDSLGSKIGRYFFKKDIARVHRSTKMLNLQDAKNIGVIYDASSETDYTVVCDFVKSLQDKSKNVKALGFVNFKEVPHYCFPKLSFDYFTKKNLNWYKKPDNKAIQDFIKIEFDILFDLNIHTIFPLLYITSNSFSTYKIGRFSENYKQLYDFMIEVPNETSIKEFIEHITHYSTNIKIKTDEQ